MRVLVTGHDGYIGSVMVGILRDAGHEVVGLDTFFFKDCALGVTYPCEKIPYISKDLRDVTVADLEGFDAVIHLAALCNDPLGDLNPELTYEINYLSSVRLAKLAKEAGVKRFLFSSSCSVYGSSGDELLTEEAPLRPLTAYAVSKVRSEEDLSRLADRDFCPVFLRNATAYGVSPRFRADLVLNNLVCWAYTTGKVRILSAGLSWRPIVHVRDIACAFAAVLASPWHVVHGQAFNVGVNGENYRVHELAQIVQETVPGCFVEYVGSKEHDPRNYRVDFSKAAKLLTGFKPTWNARSGAEEIFCALQQNRLTMEDFHIRYTRLAHLKHLLDSERLDSALRWSKGVQANG